MTKVLVATEKPFAAIAVKGIKKIVEDAGFEFGLFEKYTDKGDFIKAVGDADALIVRSDIVDRDIISSAGKLKIVVRAGAGYDNLDLKAASEKKIVAMNTPGQNSNAVAELVMGMMIYHARGCFSGKSGTELLGKTLGLHAYGNVGKRVAAIARGFGMKVYAYDPFVPAEEMEKAGVTPVKGVEELYKKCQYISLHMPANEKTRGSINYSLLSLMPEGATLVNTARKEVIDEVALVKIFQERKDFKYLSDITPDCAAEIASQFEGRYYFTPKKMGAQTAEANINAGIAAANQIVKFFKTGDTTFQLNK
ncbi:MAG: NAD(P)-dependent oxidoreductase [Bacteroidales bacterium]|nr:3-phosphoglycerate dehydrogenase [Lentimicrobiaceae bacterium]MDD5694727.1 NAD(P)-dependent oxidoreductase [Bacteroidales bacterium]